MFRKLNICSRPAVAVEFRRHVRMARMNLISEISAARARRSSVIPQGQGAERGRKHIAKRRGTRETRPSGFYDDPVPSRRYRALSAVSRIRERLLSGLASLKAERRRDFGEISSSWKQIRRRGFKETGSVDYQAPHFERLVSDDAITTRNFVQLRWSRLSRNGEDVSAINFISILFPRLSKHDGKISRDVTLFPPLSLSLENCVISNFWK